MYLPIERTDSDYKNKCKRVLGILFAEDTPDEVVMSRMSELCGLSKIGSTICEIDALVLYLGKRSYVKKLFKKCKVGNTFFTRGVHVTRISKHLCNIQHAQDILV